MAARQHGVLARWQLLELGFAPATIDRRVAGGRLHRVARGIYAVGRPELSTFGRWMAATLACGPRAVLSHGSAAALWGFGREEDDLIEISLRLSSTRRRPGIRVYRRPQLRDRDVTSLSRIPVTGVVRTLIDYSSRLDPASIDRVVNEADARGLIDFESLRASLSEYPGHWGVGRLRSVIDRHAFALTDSELERRFLPLAHGAGLPVPLTQQFVNGFRVDFFWPDLGLVVETDGLRYHSTPAQQGRDRRRDQAHVRAGLTPLRFTHAQVRFEPAYVRVTLAEVAAMLGSQSSRPGRSGVPATPQV